MSDTSTSDVEHGIRIESTQIYSGFVDSSEPERLTGDADPPERSTWKTSESFGLEFEDESKITFECLCGRRFRKPETAREHLESVTTSTETDRCANTDESDGGRE